MSSIVIHQLGASSKVIGSPSRGEKSFPARFDQVLMKAVDVALYSMLGESGATAVKFYMDTALICEDPEQFEESMRKLFGSSAHGQELIEKKILDTLVGLLREEHSIIVPVAEWERLEGRKTFSDFIRACRKEFSNAKSSA